MRKLLLVLLLLTVALSGCIDGVVDSPTKPGEDGGVGDDAPDAETDDDETVDESVAPETEPDNQVDTGYSTIRNFEVSADNFRSMDEIAPHNDIDAGGDVWELERDERALGTLTHEGESLDRFLDRTMTTGFVVVHDGKVVYEDYRQGYDETTQATSWSVAKSFTSALVGIAVEEGDIDSVDDPVVEYVPELEGSGYADVTVYDLLTMSSGVSFEENYDDPTSDIYMLFIDAYTDDHTMVEQMAEIEQVSPPGTRQAYLSSDTVVLGLVVREATGQRLSDYAEEKLWKPAGMEEDAFWSTDSAGTEIAMCCLNAQVRDYARFGLLYLNDGVRADTGEQVVPADWVHESTVNQPLRVEPGSGSIDYGYKWWIRGENEYEAVGVYGQSVYVDAERDVVIAKTSAGGGGHLGMYRAVAEEVAG